MENYEIKCNKLIFRKSVVDEFFFYIDDIYMYSLINNNSKLLNL